MNNKITTYSQGVLPIPIFVQEVSEIHNYCLRKQTVLCTKMGFHDSLQT